MRFNEGKVCNWKNYSNALIKGGELMLNFNTIFLSKLYYTGSQKRGGFRVYSTKMYE